MTEYNEEQLGNINRRIKRLMHLEGKTATDVSNAIFTCKRTTQRLLAGEAKWDSNKIDNVAKLLGVSKKYIEYGIDVTEDDIKNAITTEEGYLYARRYIQEYLLELPDDEWEEEIVSINVDILKFALRKSRGTEI